MDSGNLFLIVLVLILGLLQGGSCSYSATDQQQGAESSGYVASSVMEAGFDSDADDHETLPEFMTILYKCWSKRTNTDMYKMCLESVAGEPGEQIAQIMSSNTVTAFIGVCKLISVLINITPLIVLFFRYHSYNQ